MISTRSITSATDRPTAQQIVKAHPHLDQAAKIATVFALGRPIHSEISRGFLIDNVRRAADALGYDLVERGKPHLVSSQDDNVTGFGR